MLIDRRLSVAQPTPAAGNRNASYFVVCRLLQANGFDVAAVLDSPAAVAAFSTATGVPTSESPAEQLPGRSSAAVGNAAAAGVTAADGVQHPAGGAAVSAEMCVIVATPSQDWTAGAAAADTAGGVDMRPDNVECWFTKVGSRGRAWVAFWHGMQWRLLLLLPHATAPATTLLDTSGHQC